MTPRLFPYFGAKNRIVAAYPPPRFGTIIEPFAGSATYSRQYWDRSVILCDRDPTIAALWRWLIAASPDDVRALPIPNPGVEIPRDLHPGAHALIGFWNAGRGSDRIRRRMPSADVIRDRIAQYNYTWWHEGARDQVASLVPRFKHWLFIEASYDDLPNASATWFIDPPYVSQPRAYRHGTREIDYTQLGEWCRNRDGQVIVCEAEGASWLPFAPLVRTQAKRHKGKWTQSREVIWRRE